MPDTSMVGYSEILDTLDIYTGVGPAIGSKVTITKRGDGTVQFNDTAGNTIRSKDKALVALVDRLAAAGY